MALARFHPAVRRWFEQTFTTATPAQEAAWEAIAAGRHTLISAPTGSGKTLAGFLAVIDAMVRKAQDAPLEAKTHVLYVSPLKALSNDIQKNLQLPLEGIRRELVAELAADAPIRAWVRTGDTPQSERARMRRTPPHILVTTPESLYVLLTSESGRDMLSGVETVIIDEIHALVSNKRGAHLALSLERLEALTGRSAIRIGISATTRPLDLTAGFLLGTRRSGCEIVDVGHVRERDLALELPRSPLEALMSNEVWAETYDRLTELVEAHHTTLIFVNTRRLAERVARHLAERLGEEWVTSHHGSLAREHRLRAEERLKAGQLKALVATASLELGIDIGDVDLVCQLGSPGSIATFLQRIGRSGHGLDALPKGRLFPLSRDELVEAVALIDAVKRGELDALQMSRQPLDVLAQHIVAEVGMRDWSLDELRSVLCRAACYRDLDREVFDSIVDMLASGFSTHRGRRSAHLHFDRVNRVLRARKGARLTAITNGGAIPDQFDYDVVLLPQETPVGTLNEDFAFDSLPGDIFQLGNMSYRIVRVHTGKVYVEDAAGLPPNIPFWFGEAPGRSDVLSAAVSRLRGHIDQRLGQVTPEALARELADEYALPGMAAWQLSEYLAAARAVLGGLPTLDRVIFERFFDETGDTHLVIHSPYGSRINRAWGLALRKKFCRRFNFELQAAALEDSIVLSLGAVHSFALDEVARYLASKTVADVLAQAVLGAPVFPTYWRWNATIALAVRRFRDGRKAPPQFQRTDAEDLLATVFPDQLACAENLSGGDREIPDHPLIAQTMHDCLHGNMDVEGLTRLVAGIESGEIFVHCAEPVTPSPLAQEVLAARNYAFLDDAPAEERRTLAVRTRRYLPVAEAEQLGSLDVAAIERVQREAWPDVHNAEELHDALVTCGFLTAAEVSAMPHWQSMTRMLCDQQRVCEYRLPLAGTIWVSAERLLEVELALPQGEAVGDCARLPLAAMAPEDAVRELIRGRLAVLGPVTADGLAVDLAVDEMAVTLALLALEQEGVAMRGRFTAGAGEQWCDRRLLARIHRYTLKRLRSEIEAVSLAVYQRFLFEWQGLGQSRREGSQALLGVLSELQGVVVPAAAWERAVLPARVADYGGDLLDPLTLSGEIVWWRPQVSSQAPRQTVAASPVAIVPRAALACWQALGCGRSAPDTGDLGTHASRLLGLLDDRGALFFADLVAASGLLRVQVEEALGELVARGLVTADSFNGLRALITPQRSRGRFRGPRRTQASLFDTAGRWSRTVLPSAHAIDPDEALERVAMVLLRRYGVVARALVQREPLAPPWRDLLRVYRRAEARGEIRGGRFVEPFGGEQFALIDAVEALRRQRRAAPGHWLAVSAIDPAQLANILNRDARVAQITGNRIVFRDGEAVAAATGTGFLPLGPLDIEAMQRARRALGHGANVALLGRSTGRGKMREHR